MKRICLLLLLVFYCGPAFTAEFLPAPDTWPKEMKKVEYLSPIDNSMQPAIVYIPETQEPVPLLITLHSWRGEYDQVVRNRAPWCLKHKWAFISPDFRGENTKPQACGSDFVVADIVAGIEFMKKTANIDPNRIYLIGSSGGGHVAVLMAGRHPEIFAAVSAWVGVYDLKAFYEANEGKRPDIEACCGGPPGASAAVDKEYRNRSPLTWIKNAANLPLDLNHGILDEGVHLTQSINAYNTLAAPEKRVSQEDAAYFLKEKKVPPALEKETQVDPSYGNRHKVLFRRDCGNVRLTIFSAGHQAVDNAALTWLARQRKGQTADWSLEKK